MEMSDRKDEESDQLTPSTQSEYSDGDRVLWSRKIESMLSFIGLCVGLGNLWRFPYLCMRNGGGAFLIPFLLCLIFCGFPVYFLEMSLAQFTGKDALHTWEVCPIFRGVGHGMVVATILLTFYYNVIIAWAMFYIGNSFIDPLPWRSCGNKWNTAYCINTRSSNVSQISSNLSDNNSFEIAKLTTPNITWTQSSNLKIPQIRHRYMTSEEEFWQYRALNLSSGIEDVGGMPWHLPLCFLGAWTLVTLCLIRGVKSMGKVVYVTAILPYILLTVILIRTIFLPGATDGILFFLTPDFSKLRESQVWVEAALQVFYSLCPGWGQILTMASYNKFHNNCYKDSIILTAISEGTSIYGGFVVFAVIGYMAHDANLPIATVVKSGPGLGFVVYPEALSTLPLPNLWSALFFLMLLSVALDSEFACVEVVIAGITNHFRVLRNRQILVTVGGSLIYFLLGLIFCTQAGIYFYQIFDWYVAVSVPVFLLIECIIFGWIYGAERFSRDIEMMLGRGVPVFVRICWCFVDPVVLLLLFVSTFILYQSPTYGDYVYPPYVNLLGWCVGIMPLVPVLLVGVKTVMNTPGDSIIRKFQESLQPSPYWKPISKKHASGYNMERNTSSVGFWRNIKLNVLGKTTSTVT